MTFTLGDVPLGLSAVVGISLAGILLRYGAHRPAHRALAAFLGLHGALNLVRVARTFAEAPSIVSLLAAYERYFWLADGLMLLALVVVYPAPRAWLPAWATRLWPYLAALALLDLAYLLDHDLMIANGRSSGPLAYADFVLDGAYALVPLVLARDAFRRRAGGDWRSVGLLAIGLPIYFLYFTSGMVATLAARGFPSGSGAVVALVLARAGLFVVLLGYVAWLTRTASPEKRPLARFGATLMAVSVATGVMAVWFDGAWSYIWQSVWFLVTPALVAYALLRHQLLGIDVKTRWTISKSTVAAVFIAVFFIVSEAAQQFFGETLGSQYVGIAAAGALVFVIAPLQRVAERLAENAVPSSSPAAPTGSTAEDTYRSAVARLLSDGSLSRDDERLLARLAADLGIDARRAFEAREAVEAELPVAPDAGAGVSE